MSSVVYRNAVTQCSDLVKILAKLPPNDEFNSIINSLKNATLSTSDSWSLFNTCYKNNYKDRQLFINYIDAIENAFFGTLEKCEDNNDYRNLILNLPVQAKVKIILGDQDTNLPQEQTYKDKLGRKSSFNRIIIDAERFEKAGLKKLKKVTTAKFANPIIKHRIPGLRLAKSLASSIREKIDKLNLQDLGHICKIFTIKHPFTGSIIEDTIQILVFTLEKQKISELSQIIYEISLLYKSAIERYIELQLDTLDSVEYPNLKFPSYIKELEKLINKCTLYIKSQNNSIGITPEIGKEITTNLLFSCTKKKLNINTVNFWLHLSVIQAKK